MRRAPARYNLERMDKAFSPADIESRIYAFWEERGYFAPSGRGPAYSIVIPPPNVTGTLHMGHAFQDTIMDALVRYKRMCGFDTLWQPGMDHAGIATQMVVERQLNAEGQSRIDLGREAFVERVWEWKNESGGAISRQLRRLGASVDWRREKFTMDPELSAAVTEAFVRLFREGLIYRGKRLVNWDPVLKTALSDLEVVSVEEWSSLWHLRYPLAEGGGYLVVATTRPETMLGDAAVAVHPDDERYRHLIGRNVRLPLAQRDIPIIGDAYVDPAFGSGCVKITPAHDFNDYEIGQRHGLPLINIMTPEAALNENVPPAYRGLDRGVARTRIVADLEALGLVERIEPHQLTVPRGDRSNAVLEPLLTDQWFVDIKPLAAPAIRAVEAGHIRFVPETLVRRLFRVDAQHQGLVHQPAAVVGTPHPRMVRRRRPVLRRAQRSRSAQRARTRPLDRVAAGRGRPRHLVLLGDCGPSPRRVAPGHARPAHVLSDVGPGHRLRHHFLLGRPHDHVGPQVHRAGSISRGVCARPDPRPRRPEDVQVQGQRDRSARHRGRNIARGAHCQAYQRLDAAPDAAGDRESDPQAVSEGDSRLRHGCACA